MKACSMLIVLVISSYLPAFAQWNIYTTHITRTKEYDLMPAPGTCKQEKAFIFFGAASDLYENVIIGGACPFAEATGSAYAKLGSNRPVWEINMAAKNELLDNAPYSFYLDFYSENIGRCAVYLETAAGEWLEKKVEIKNDKYHIPLEVNITRKEFSSAGTVADPTLAKPNEAGQSKTINRIILAIDKREAVKPYKFVVGNCAIYKTVFGKEQAKGAFFYDFTKDKRYAAPRYLFNNFGNSVPIKQFASFSNFSIPEYHFETDSMVHANGTEEAATINLFRYFIERYPYYKERNLNKQKIGYAMDSIAQLKCPLKIKLEKIDSLINRFNDGHFYIMTRPSAKQVNGPLLAKEIKGKIYVVGVFDSTLGKKIQPGMEIVDIDHSPVNRYIDSAALKYHGDQETTRQMAVSRLFYRALPDSILVTFQNGSGARQEMPVYFKKQNAVPDNFRSEHGFFYTYPNNWGYLKLNRWQTTDWIPFYNLADTLIKLNGLIFDLRGNGGGAQLQAIRILTCFLKKPAVYSYNTYESAGAGNKLYLGSHIVIPNKYLNLSKLKVIILVDGMTACASEVFINGMKKYCSAIVVGSENTNGAYADAAYFYLPRDIVVKANLLDKLYLSRDLRSIEGTGIRPDILVDITKYEDLYPYQDKILKEALGITDRLNGDHAFKVAHGD